MLIKNFNSVHRDTMPRYLQSLTKSVKNFALSYTQETYPANLAPWWPLPPPLPGQCCLVGSKNVRATLQHCFLGEEGGVSWVNRALEGSIFKLQIQRAFFLTFLSKIVGGLYQARATAHDLRGTNKLTVPCVKTTTHGLHSFRYASTTLWNRLPEDLRSTTWLREFKLKLRLISFEQIK